MTKLSLEFFIAQRLSESKDKEGNTSGIHHIVKIAIIGVAISLAVMIISVAIITGFKKEIRNKVIGFGSHITITNFDTNNSYETEPIERNQSYYKALSHIKGVNHIQAFALKAGIIKTSTDLQGVVLKGIGSDFDWKFFSKNIIDGTSFEVNDSIKSDKILISKYISKQLKLRTGEDLVMYFIQNPPRLRKFKIGGIYETGLEEYDKMYVLVDIAHIQKLNNWNKSQISGFEILIDDYDKLNEVTDSVKEKIGFQFFDNGSTLKVRNVVQNNPQIFDWLDLTDTNVWVILILMVIVASFNMISGLLVLILDRTNMIGILKALGMENFRIRKIFMFQSINIIVKGIFWGNISGLSICLIQFFGEVIKLDPSSYYVNNVPVNISLLHFFLLNIGVFLIIAGILIVPSVLIKYITPVKAIRFN